MTVLVQNGSEEDLDVELVLRAHGFEWDPPLGGGPSAVQLVGRKVRVSAMNRTEARFPARATTLGTAVLQAVAVSGEATDAAELRFPVKQSLPVEMVAVHGELRGPGEREVHVETLVRPAGALDDLGGLEVELASTRLQSLSGSIEYLLDYPYGCAEQIASRLLGMIALLDLEATLPPEGFPRVLDLREKISIAVTGLQSLQSYDGAWSYWKWDRTDPYLSAHVAHALERARRAGFPVQESRLDRWETYAAEGLREYPDGPGVIRVRKPTEDDAARPENLLVQAYEFYARRLRREGEPERCADLRREVRAWLAGTKLENLPPEAAAWTLAVLGSHADSSAEAAELRRRLENAVVQTPRGAQLVTPVDPSWRFVLPSSLRAHAILLEALLEVDPASELVGKLTEGLLARREGGRWRTTEDNAHALMALGPYLRSVEAVSSDFVGRAWLDENLLCERRFEGRDPSTCIESVPAASLGVGSIPRRLTISREGEGTLFFQARLRYALAEGVLPTQAGFEIARVYEGVDSDSDVETAEDGTVRVKAGALVRVRLFVFTSAPRRHVALVDPFPAELGSFPADETRFRDDRAEAFAVSLPGGVLVHEYRIRATTLGVFFAPPPKAEAMYEPEVFGYGPAARVRIVESE
jgi:uncharacterized protein YfaS (alpha-2-macroglobulin family)